MSARTLLVQAALVALATSAACGNAKLHPITRVPDGGPPPADTGVEVPPPPPPWTAPAPDASVCADELLPSIHDPFADGSMTATFEGVMDLQTAGIGVGLHLHPCGSVEKPCFEPCDCGHGTDPLIGAETDGRGGWP